MHATAPAPLYAPRGQVVQACAPAARLLYEPARQAVHTAEVAAVGSLLYRPAGHSEQAGAPGPLYVPGAHAEHACAPPVALLYAPGAQAVQAWGTSARD